MKPNRLMLVAAFSLLALLTFAQKNKFTLLLKGGAVVPLPNISSAAIESFNVKATRLSGKTFAILQFEELPSEVTKKQLAQSGIQLLEYVPNNAYTVTITGRADKALLQRLKVRALYSLLPQQKLHPALQNNMSGPGAKLDGAIEVWVKVPKSFTIPEATGALKLLNIELVPSQYQAYQILVLRIAANRLPELAALPYIEYVQPAPPPVQPLNYNNRRGSRANVLNAAATNGGKGLNGEGVVIGIGDESGVTHIDLTGREINRSLSVDHSHPTHVHGIAAGAGIVKELYRGYAPKAMVISQYFQRIITEAPTYVQDYGMIATNNSYGVGFDCSYNGVYDLNAYMLDQQAFDLPYLQHVFAAGNSGHRGCTPYPTGFKTVFGGYQSAKNILCVGNCDDEGNLYYSSSKGPVKDGRVKPDVVADGTAVISTWPTNGYATDWGTSMAAPSVTGGVALLNQRYRQLHNNAVPKSALMKAVICNGATDRGNAGIDFSYGYGSMNLLRSIAMLEDNHYFTGNSTNGSADEQILTIPANTAQLKILLYWHDPAASLLSTQALVNDLDLEVSDPSATTLFPQKLDTATANVAAVATTGADHINNMEQVTVQNPAAGNYTVRVKGTSIAQNPSQEYIVVYDMVPASLQLTYPVGGEGLAPGETTKISWDACGSAANFTLQYSLDNGTNWTDISTTINADQRFYTWQVPSTATEKALVRVSQNGTSFTSTSHPFTIIGIPAASLSSTQCEGYIAFNWAAIPDATDYEVMMLRGDEMASKAITSSTSYTFNSLSKDSTYWVSVRARINGKAGRRADALSRQPYDGNCSGTISDNDLKLDSIVSPLSGRKYTSTELSAATPVRVKIKNLDDAPVAAFSVRYSTDGVNWTTENVSATIAPGATYTYTFAATANFSAPGLYTLYAEVHNNTTDTITGNDRMITVVKQLNNQPLDLTNPFVDDIETATTATYLKDTIGLSGLDPYDFKTSSLYGELRTFVNTGIASSGTKALTLDKVYPNNTSTINNVTGTFNLSNYTAAANNIRLDFKYAYQAQSANDPNNSVWARGSDVLPWVKVFDLSKTTVSPTALFNLTPSIELTDSLLKSSQDFSSSFQIKWSQNATGPGSDKYALYSVDDIRIYQAVNDMQLLSIDTPYHLSCGLSSQVPLKVSIRNSNNTTIYNVPVRYSVNNGAWISETIPSIAAKTTLQYEFTNKVDFSGTGSYQVTTIVDYPADNYRLNDTATLSLYNAPLVATFPYLQNFEAGDGGWYAEGKNSTWQYGTPASTKINRAASGAKAWKTSLSGNYNDEELSYLYSPCFDIGTLTHPTLSFNVALDLEDCGSTLCDAGWIEYTADGITWTKLLDASNTGTNWYNASSKTLWSVGDYTYWHVATVALPTTVSRIRFRFVLASDEGVNKEGIAIDDIHVYDNTKGIYSNSSLSAIDAKPVTGGTSWIDFESGGTLIASIQPNNQNLGNTNVQVYINTSAVRDTLLQYYHDRNITIRPDNRNLNDSVTVRFYFLDKEVEALRTASDCANCSAPSGEAELGVSKYNNADTTLENGTLSDNKGGYWQFINAANAAKVPFDKGYYCEFKVKDFSEFWLSKNSLGNLTPLPVDLLGFIAQKASNNDVIVKWDVANEQGIDGYEVQVARSTGDLNANHFETLKFVASINSTIQVQYTFTDIENPKAGVRYYRLKIKDKNGSVKYSPIRSVLFDNTPAWLIYPNPSSGKFQLIYQLGAGEIMMVKITDVTGRVVHEIKVSGDGFVQKQIIDLSSSQYASGMYLMQTVGNHPRIFKLYKQ